MLPLALWHLNVSPTAALGGRSPYWARNGVSPNVTALPPLEQLFELLGFPRWVGWWVDGWGCEGLDGDGGARWG